MQPNTIKELIEKNLPESTAIVEGDDGVHFSAIVICADFSGKNRVQKQQMVYTALGNHMIDGTIHALSIKTFTPEEWHSHR